MTELTRTVVNRIETERERTTLLNELHERNTVTWDLKPIETYDTETLYYILSIVRNITDVTDDDSADWMTE